MPKRSVIGVLEHQGLVALAKKDPQDTGRLAGKLHLPGGRIEEEQPYQAVVRELCEEIGVHVTPKQFLSHHYLASGTHVLWYLCKPTKDSLNQPALTPGGDVVDALWTPRNNVLALCPEASTYWPESIKKFFRQTPNKQPSHQSLYERL